MSAGHDPPYLAFDYAEHWENKTIRQTMKQIFCLLLVAFLAGCVNKVWVNPNLNDTEARQAFYQVSAQCQGYANGSAPYVPPAAVPQGSYSTTTYSGTVTQNYNYANQARYQGTATTYSPPDQSAVANANAQNVASIVSSIRRDNAYSECMNGNGWQLMREDELAALRARNSASITQTSNVTTSISASKISVGYNGYDCLREEASRRSIDVIAFGAHMREKPSSEVRRLEIACDSKSAEMEQAFDR